MFTYKEYGLLIELMKQVNIIYTFKTLPEKPLTGVILRHDIDFDIETAYVLSQIEEQKDVRSTYFVLTSSETYNPNASKNRRLLRNMHDKGFDIGLHFDPLVYGNLDDEKMQSNMKNECSILENIINDKVYSVSLHRPSIYNVYPVFQGYKNAYSPEFFNSELYISDSCKDFRGKNIFEFIRKGKEDLIQVLLHPIHFSETELTYEEALNKIFKRNINELDCDMRLNKKYNEEMGNKKLLDCFCKYADG
ncbi:hypothetical protein [Clostridium folliculivorans]|uniref:Uncharacterized protein n=1 Tax=Clostridium folliculivorans TaxID=2886038 RepID=A0A9W5Y3R1_9CLOT|nr:hypothetical protein [Clostridium folliculivorans]GKU25988.1 hypothetical protein CFOLD11_28150 [Clostridium folliculivorans]GKU28074.1 hypothetical protein CFB3_01800 [Clostridium folliculivorans]